MNVAVIGLGYIGAVYAGCLASLGHQVIGYDIDQEKVRRYGAGQPVIYEPGFTELLQQVVEEGRLRTTDQLLEAVDQSEVILLCVGTPALSNGEVDTQYINATANQLGQCLTSLSGQRVRVIVNKSTVPVGTCELIQETVGERAIVVANPEFTQEGLAVHGFFQPDQIIVGLPNGTEAGAALAAMEQLYAPLSTPITWMSIRAAEMCKLAINSKLATDISLANALAELCESLGVNYSVVGAAMKRDPRIGPRAFIKPGPGFGGSCFPKDVAGLRAVAAHSGQRLAQLLGLVLTINNDQVPRLLDRLLFYLEPISGQTVAVCGVGFKAGTDDLRNSPSLALIQELLSGGAKIKWYDPIVRSLPIYSRGVERCLTPELSAARASAIILMTELTTVRCLDFRRLRESMVEPYLLYDARNVLRPEIVEGAGLTYLATGRPAER